MPISVARFLDQARADVELTRQAAQAGDAAAALEPLAQAIACLVEAIKLLDGRTAAVDTEPPAPPPPLG